MVWAASQSWSCPSGSLSPAYFLEECCWCWAFDTWFSIGGSPTSTSTTQLRSGVSPWAILNGWGWFKKYVGVRDTLFILSQRNQSLHSEFSSFNVFLQNLQIEEQIFWPLTLKVFLCDPGIGTVSSCCWGNGEPWDSPGSREQWCCEPIASLFRNSDLNLALNWIFACQFFVKGKSNWVSSWLVLGTCKYKLFLRWLLPRTWVTTWTSCTPRLKNLKRRNQIFQLVSLWLWFDYIVCMGLSPSKHTLEVIHFYVTNRFEVPSKNHHLGLIPMDSVDEFYLGLHHFNFRPSGKNGCGALGKISFEKKTFENHLHT